MTQMNMEALWVVLFLTLAITAASVTISKAKVFRPMRKWLKTNRPWFGQLTSCFYCTSHWLAFGAVAIYQPHLVNSGYVFPDLAVSAFVMVTINAFIATRLIDSMEFEGDDDPNSKEEQELLGLRVQLERAHEEIAGLKEGGFAIR